ncbi:MAG: bifunctional metallophosphatase/5'-nucleotidase [candidate division KSB1 bacterium]|nr:bifunctional metallophosphatase/5'-nucleotidase [candidate division KSB1 bacterium]
MYRTMPFFLSAALCIPLNCNRLASQEPAKSLTIIHTNDLQSRLLPFAPNRDYTPAVGDDHTIGGIARVATVIKSLKQKSPETTLVIDGGDFMMGTLFHTISREESAELRLMHEIGYDAVVLGNHEFDFWPKGLAQIITTALAKGNLPPLILANAVFSDTDPRDDALQQLFEQGVVKSYRVYHKSGLKIGVFGLLGKNAAEVSPFVEPLTFADPVKTARKIAKQLKEEERVDVIICASHGGVWKKPEEKQWQGEDIALASQVPEIDVVVGGHSHTLLKEPIIVNGTPVVQAGAEGRSVGVLDLRIRQGAVEIASYRSIAITDSIAADPLTQAEVDRYRMIINRNFLSQAGYAFDQVVAETDFDLTINEDDSNLGNLVSDAMRWRIDQCQYDPAFPKTRTVVAIESNGLIRDDLVKGQSGLLQVSDLFRVVPLGIGMVEDSPGYPLVSFYLTAEEIKRALEVLTSVYPLQGIDYYLQPSGLRFRYNTRRVIFDRVIEIEIEDEKGEYQPLDLSSGNRELYKVGCNIFVATFIKIVGNFTYGILTMTPKDSSGQPIEELRMALIDADSDSAGIQEVKEWEALLAYVQTFPDTDGNEVPNMSARYRHAQGRIQKVSSMHPALLFKNATYLTWGATSLVLGALLAVFALIRLVIIKFKTRYDS